MAKLGAEHATLLEEMKTGRLAREVLEDELRAERDLSTSIGLAAWQAMVALEEAVSHLGASAPPRRHKPEEMDITLERLRSAGEVCLPAARSYGDHCAKTAWSTTLASLDKAGCAHIDAVASRSVAVATLEEVAASHRRTRRASRVLLQDFWALRGHQEATESIRAVQAQRQKGKAPEGGSAGDAEAGRRGSTHVDKV